MYYLYVLYSGNYDRRYVGISSDPTVRLLQHNSKEVRSTKAYAPWSLVYTEKYDTKKEARIREIQIKKDYHKREELYKIVFPAASSSNG